MGGCSGGEADAGVEGAGTVLEHRIITPRMFAP